ncbi:MarR family winged helix-turn-helix transcriptional regulator [Paenibacillus rubinfantis]|jgi:DNA-binding MarR family transcriptional regulator|uniref:MarR family winged helix-turn-helix transcriptional regulator n=1 Tax=Paenibacillus rubinfantis TaxID=1720296 RepID=UPI00073F113F|nr:MarR family winged helix-turn-helix transcriptional regulator [Paenibacillus rubinfantis]
MDNPSVGKLITYLQRINQKEMAAMLKPYGIGSGGNHSYLLTILTKPGLNQDQLTSLVQFDKATTTRSVKQLEEAGYIERRVDERDRRSILLYPTEKGRAFEPELRKMLADFNRRLTSVLSEAEKNQLQALLTKVYESKQPNN